MRVLPLTSEQKQRISEIADLPQDVGISVFWPFGGRGSFLHLFRDTEGKDHTVTSAQIREVIDLG